MSSNKPTYYCWEFFNLGCCTSCHDEWNDGYGEPFEDDEGDFIFMHCCSAKLPTKEQIEKIELERKEKEAGAK